MFQDNALDYNIISTKVRTALDSMARSEAVLLGGETECHYEDNDGLDPWALAGLGSLLNLTTSRLGLKCGAARVIAGIVESDTHGFLRRSHEKSARGLKTRMSVTRVSLVPLLALFLRPWAACAGFPSEISVFPFTPLSPLIVALSSSFCTFLTNLLSLLAVSTF